MRIFRVKKRWITNVVGKRVNKVLAHRDYMGIEKFIKHAPEVISRYKSTYNGIVEPEVYELIEGVWKKLTDEQTKEILV